MQANASEQENQQILSHCIPIDNFDHKVITPNFDGVNSADVVCPVCQDRFQIGKKLFKLIFIGSLATK